MTGAQQSKYFAEWGKLRDVLRARGLTSAQCEAHRHDLTRKAVGHAKSSRDLTNAEFDAVLAAISAQLRPGDLDSQLALQDMPEKRVALLHARIDELSHQLGLDPGHEDHYVDGIARRMYGKPRRDLPERALQQLEGILLRRIRQVRS